MNRSYTGDGQRSAIVRVTMPEEPQQPKPEERVSIPLDPEEALRALLKVDPDAPPIAPKGRDKPSDAAQ
jgi:hypothetical protein